MQTLALMDWGEQPRVSSVMPITKLPEITGPHVKFAQMVREITGEVTRNQAEYRAGVSHMTIAKMWRGEKVSETMIIRFAKGYKIDPNPLLKALGYSPLPYSETADIRDASTLEEDCLDRLAPTGFENMPLEAHAFAKQAAYQAFVMMYRLEMQRWNERTIAGQSPTASQADRDEIVRQSPDPAQGYIDTTGVSAPDEFRKNLFPGLLPKSKREPEDVQ